MTTTDMTKQDLIDKYKLDMTGYPKTHVPLNEDGLYDPTEDILDSIRSQVTRINGYVVWTPEERERKFHYKRDTHMIHRHYLHLVLKDGPVDARLSILNTLKEYPHNRLSEVPRFAELPLARLREWIRETL